MEINKVKMSLDGESEMEGLESLEMSNKLVITNKKMEVKELPSPEQLKGGILLNASKSHFFRMDLL